MGLLGGFAGLFGGFVDLLGILGLLGGFAGLFGILEFCGFGIGLLLDRDGPRALKILGPFRSDVIPM